MGGTIPRYCTHTAYEYLCTNDSEHLALFAYEVLENLSHSKCLHYAYFVSIFVSPEKDASPMYSFPRIFAMLNRADYKGPVQFGTLESA